MKFSTLAFLSLSSGFAGALEDSYGDAGYGAEDHGAGGYSAGVYDVSSKAIVPTTTTEKPGVTGYGGEYGSHTTTAAEKPKVTSYAYGNDGSQTVHVCPASQGTSYDCTEAVYDNTGNPAGSYVIQKNVTAVGGELYTYTSTKTDIPKYTPVPLSTFAYKVSGEYTATGAYSAHPETPSKSGQYSVPHEIGIPYQTGKPSIHAYGTGYAGKSHGASSISTTSTGYTAVPYPSASIGNETGPGNAFPDKPQTEYSAEAYTTSVGLTPPMATHTVHVGGTRINGSHFFPQYIKANEGDTVRFNFEPTNHTVSSSDFESPCSWNGAFDSGFMAVSAKTVEPEPLVMDNITVAHNETHAGEPFKGANETKLHQGYKGGNDTKKYNSTDGYKGLQRPAFLANETHQRVFVDFPVVNGSEPLWFFSRQVDECSAGMVFAINPESASQWADFYIRATTGSSSGSSGASSSPGITGTSGSPGSSSPNGSSGSSNFQGQSGTPVASYVVYSTPPTFSIGANSGAATTAAVVAIGGNTEIIQAVPTSSVETLVGQNAGQVYTYVYTSVVTLYQTSPASPATLVYPSEAFSIPSAAISSVVVTPESYNTVPQPQGAAAVLTTYSSAIPTLTTCTETNEAGSVTVFTTISSVYQTFTASVAHTHHYKNGTATRFHVSGTGSHIHSHVKPTTTVSLPLYEQNATSSAAALSSTVSAINGTVAIAIAAASSTIALPLSSSVSASNGTVSTSTPLSLSNTASPLSTSVTSPATSTSTPPTTISSTAIKPTTTTTTFPTTTPTTLSTSISTPIKPTTALPTVTPTTLSTSTSTKPTTTTKPTTSIVAPTPTEIVLTSSIGAGYGAYNYEPATTHVVPYKRSVAGRRRV